MSSTFEKYGLSWDSNYYADPARIEMVMIQNGGQINGYGSGLLHHYLEFRKLIFPNRYTHRWVILLYTEFLANQMTVMMGSASCGKTSTASEFCLLDYWCFPETTAVLVSTTTADKLESAVFGEMKMLFREAKKARPWLAGHVIDHKKCIVTDDIEEIDARDMRKGILGKACYVGKQYVGLGVYAGIKQERIRFIADELQFMPSTFLDCLPNMFSNPDVKVFGSANPNHDPEDQLGIAAEPLDGWSSVAEITKTTVWPTRFMDSKCVNLIGIDSPNFDVPEGQKEPFPRLIGRRFAAKIEHDYGKNSPQYEKQVMGRMKLTLSECRVITRDTCSKHKAHEKLIWQGVETTLIKAIDPAYGGGDRCIDMDLEFGLSVEGKQLLRVVGYRLIRIDLASDMTPEEQIAFDVFRDSRNKNIPPANIFYDSFGRGTVGFAFARQFGSNSPIPVDSGGRTTKRPVRDDLFVWDEVKKEKRLKRCDEHYSKFVTEMWFSVRYTVEAEQLRELPHDVMMEGCSRQYYMVAGDKIEVEPKDEMKERTGKSPDLFDALAIGVEGARQRGFKIARIGPDNLSREDFRWMAELNKKNHDWIRSKQLGAGSIRSGRGR